MFDDWQDPNHKHIPPIVYCVFNAMSYFVFFHKPGPGAGINGLDHHVDDIERQKAEPMDTVFVRQVAPSGPADRAGLSTGNNLTYRIGCF